MDTALPAAPRAPRQTLFLAVAGLGLAWNAFGIVQFVSTLRATPDSLMRNGLDAAQAAVYLGLPGWMDMAFALGVFGGAAGSLALLLRRRWAVGVLSVSMVAYVVLFGGDLGFGVFSAVPSQAAILSLVLAIAAGLLFTAHAARRSGWLR